jgi:uncharacterized protein
VNGPALRRRGVAAALAAAAAAALGGAVPVQAQAQTSPRPVVIPAAPPATPAQPDAATIAAADRLLGVMQIERQYDTILAQIIPLTIAQLTTQVRDNVQVPDALRTHLADDNRRAAFTAMLTAEVTREFRARYATMRRQTAVEYARTFTLADLEALSAFYTSTVGAKALAEMPGLQQRLMPLGMQMGMAAGQAAMARTVQALLGDGADRPRT